MSRSAGCLEAHARRRRNQRGQRPEGAPQKTAAASLPSPSSTGRGRGGRRCTIRSHDQYNTTIYSLDDRYRGVFGGRMVVFMNEDDMAERQIGEDSVVELVSLSDRKKRRAGGGFKVRAYKIPRGCIASCYPETNDLMPVEHFDPASKTPSAKSIPVLVRPVAAQA